MNRKILFGCFLLSLLGFGYGLFAMADSEYVEIADVMLVWFIMSIPLIVYYAYFKILKGGQ